MNATHSAVPLPVPTPLADAEVLDVEGRPHRLGESWQERATVLVFLRHFG